MFNFFSGAFGAKCSTNSPAPSAQNIQNFHQRLRRKIFIVFFNAILYSPRFARKRYSKKKFPRFARKKMVGISRSVSNFSFFQTRRLRVHSLVWKKVVVASVALPRQCLTILVMGSWNVSCVWHSACDKPDTCYCLQGLPSKSDVFPD